MTYLDSELLVLRDGSGLPEVLTRKDAYGSQTSPEISYDEDDAAPGAS